MQAEQPKTQTLAECARASPVFETILDRVAELGIP